MNNLEFIIYPPAKSIAFHIFNYPIRFYGLIITLALLIGFFSITGFFEKKYSQTEADKFVDYSIFLVIISLFGARLFYVLGSFDYYLNNPIEIIMINHGGISIWGAIIFGIIGLICLSKYFKFSFYLHSSVIAVFLPLCQAIGRWGNFFNQEAFGAPTNGIIKLFVDTKFRPVEFADVSYFHPAFLYESILDILIFVVLISTYKQVKPAKTFFLYILLYSVARLIVESIRIDSVYNILNIPIASIISVLFFVIGLCGLIYILKKPQEGA